MGLVNASASFNFSIINEKEDVIATFLNEYDRDTAMDALAEKFDDCKFIPVNFDEDE